MDNDCNGSVDDGIAMLTWYDDDDGDTFGGHPNLRPAPSRPGPSRRLVDSDDDDADVNPLVREVCNGYDDDCDGDTNDDDGGVDPTTQVQWFRDADNDGYGDDAAIIEACESPGRCFILENGDCDDTGPGVNPDGNEVCNLRDDDCDALVDDADPSRIDPAGQTEFFTDADLDGYGFNVADPGLPVRSRGRSRTTTTVTTPSPRPPSSAIGSTMATSTALAPVRWWRRTVTRRVRERRPSGTDINDADRLEFPGNSTGNSRRRLR